MPITAVIFDFDGLILDTELTDFVAWQEIYDDHGATLELRKWQKVIGTTFGARDAFDPYEDLERQLGKTLDREAIRIRRRSRVAELIEEQQVLPGVIGYLDEAARLGLPLGIASTSTRDWVESHLRRIGLAERFACIRCRDDGLAPKPAPDLYLAVLADLGVSASDAMALEDSPNGIRSAKGAGLYCVAVPNPLTKDLDLSDADLVLESLEQTSLASVIRKAEVARGLPSGHRESRS